MAIHKQGYQKLYWFTLRTVAVSCPIRLAKLENLAAQYSTKSTSPRNFPVLNVE